jgi:5-hydroxyisourate hydrolase-like protein (transthyretin family)
MSASLTRRRVAVGALAVTVAGGIALTAVTPAAASDGRVHTSLSIRVQKASVNPGGGDWIGGRLHARHVSVFDRRVVLQDKPAGAVAWTREAVNRTHRGGRVAFQVSPTVNTRYRLVFAGNARMRPSVSGIVIVRVRANATSLIETLGSNVIQPGGSTTVNGALSADGTPIADGTVILQSRTNAQRYFHRAASGATAEDGTISFPVTPTVNTHYRLVFRKTETNGYAQSEVETVHVQRPSSISISGRLNRSDQEVITGVLRGAGHVLPARRIELQSKPTGTTTWTTVAVHRTNRHGAVRFVQTAQSGSTDYQLVWAGGPNFAGCQSNVLTVTFSSAA